MLAPGRIALAAGALLAVYLEPTEPARFAPTVKATVSSYLALSVVIGVMVRWRPKLTRRRQAVLHALDLTFASGLILLTSGSSSPFNVFLLLVLLAAAYRYGFPGAVQAGVVLGAILVAQPFVLPYFDRESVLSMNILIVRVTYIGVMAFLVGYLAQKDQNWQAETAAVSGVLERTRAESFSAGLQATIDEVARVLGLTRALLVLTQAGAIVSAWEWTAGVPPRRMDVERVREALWFPLPGDVQLWQSARDGADSAALDLFGERVSARVTPPAAFWDALACARAVGMVMTFGNRSEARLYLPDPPSQLASSFSLHLLHAIGRQAAPALHNLYLLQAQAASEERARLARELHDRVLQSLIGVEMHLAVLQRATEVDAAVAERIKNLHAMFRAEIANVRDVMHELRPLEIGPDDLVVFLRELAVRFERETGIRTTFECDSAPIQLDATQCGDIARLVQESLINVRKHSGASEVAVRVSSDPSGVSLVVQDNGRGFPFAGRLSDDQLWSEHRGPQVIKERARALGASLSVDSQPGHGARVILVIPYAA